MDLTAQCKLKNRKHKVYIYFLMVVLAFDYVLFPLPILAKEDEIDQIFTPFVAEAASIETAEDGAIATPVVDQQCFDGQCSTVFGEDKAKNAEEVVATAKKSAKQPERQKAAGKNGGFHSMTAYTSEVAQTDSSPCITANGFNVCKHGVEDTIAANFLKFGTKVKIPELFGDRVFIVRDRMNKRYPDRVDVWMKNKPDAMKFGVRYARIEVLED